MSFNASSIVDTKPFKLERKTTEPLESLVINLNIEVTEMRQALHVLINENSAMRRVIQGLDKKCRRNNLVFSNMVYYYQPSDLVAALYEFCREFLNIDDVYINRAYYVGTMSPKYNRGVVIANFPKDSDINRIMQRARWLRGTGFDVYRDMSRETREKRQLMFQLKQNLLMLNNKPRMKVAIDHLIVDGYIFNISPRMQLMWGNTEGVDRLSILMGQNVEHVVKQVLEGASMNSSVFTNWASMSINY